MTNYEAFSFALTLYSGESVFNVQPVEICYGSLEKLDVYNWNDCHIYEWILKQTNNNYNIANIFKKNAIDGESLLEINRDDYKELLKNVNINLFLWLKIKRLQELYQK
tara:strand:- start:115 stop:438 length:324 start_codon:yes stop_codon:yes gene_type:complete